jgi:AraC-like DNA-binding protein
VTVFGVTLRAIGWKALVGMPAHSVTDHNIDGSKLFCNQAQELHDQLQAMTALDDMISAIAPLLIMRQEEVKPVPAAHLPFLRTMREWSAVEGARINQLYASIHDKSGLGERQVQRLCREYFGASPAALKRKFRAIRAAMKLYQGAPLDEVIEPFSDQSHMINDVRHYTGHTPTSLRAGTDPSLRFTLDNESFHFLPDVVPESVDVWPR